MNIRSLYNTLCEMAAPIANLSRHEIWDKVDEIGDYIIKIGGERLGSGISSNGFKVSFPWGDVAIKVSGWGCHLPTEEKLNEFPGLREHWLRPLFTSQHIVIQPMADCSNARIVGELLREKFYALYNESFDSHEGNVGEYKGRLITFDAMV